MSFISHDDLKAMNVKQLKDLCKSRGLKGYSTKLQAELITILYDDLAENPEKESTIPPADTLDDLCAELRLATSTIEKLTEQNFTCAADLDLLTPDVIDSMGLLVKDALNLKRHIKSPSASQPTRPRSPSIVMLDHSTTHPPTRPSHTTTRPRTNSFAGESDSENEFSDSLMDLPKTARDLPQPHSFISPRAGSSNSSRSPGPQDISVNEFLAESMRLVHRLSSSKDHVEVLSEYSEYLEFLMYKLCDYSAAAVMRFDEDFRRRVSFDKSSLLDNDARRTLSDRHFHSQTRQTARHQGSPYGRFRNFGNGNYQPQGGSPTQQRRDEQPRVCFRFNNATACNGPPRCTYQHVCARCGGPHRACANQCSSNNGQGRHN
ncbi:hypothetical protein BV898_14427 [Hypsibius exemplaris]|uniref:Rho termination factor-like N-terminal domain-containing protein n=1 Tax=Hypsibius exemplaris TaxID=2072580 RepID=A0A9X6NBW9_HYPEX|nr:hypothetical protein BV898_14427 [Hypsibius exemplaris]